jgi:hypothetical protein
MALKVPPAWTQGGTYTAQSDRLTAQGIISATGILGTSSLAVTAQVSPNMTVNIASGWAAILSSTSNNGIYQIYNDAVTIATITTADATNPRIDRIVATVTDGSNTVAFSVLAGTPAGSPTAPATPSDSISLATVAVAAGATSITSGNITDTRVVASSNFVTGVALPYTGGTLTGGLTLTPSTASVAPLKLQSSATLLSSATGGVVEYDGITSLFTPIAAGTGGRAQIQSSHFNVLSSQRNLTAGSTAAQSMFGTGLPLAGSTTYEIEIDGELYFTQTSATSNTYSVVLGFSSSPTSTSGQVFSGLNAGTTTIRSLSASSATLYISTSATTQSVPFILKAITRTNAATTFTPQIQASVNNTSLIAMLVNSNVRVTPIGSASVTTIGAWA